MTEIEVSVDTRYLSAGANRYAAAADWGEDGLIAFGADTNICLWDPATSKGITKLLSGHTAHVRAVQFLPRLPGDKSTYLVSGGDDHSLRVWSIDPEAGISSCHQTIQDAHTAPINCLATLTVTAESRQVLFVSGGADATVKVWTLDAEVHQVSLLQTIKTTRKYFPLAIALSRLPGDGELNAGCVILAVAGTSSAIQIFTTGVDMQFSLQANLPGHENWIRSLDFVREKPDYPDSDLLLASASQDKYIRLWRVHKDTALSALNATGMDVSAKVLMPGNKIHKIKSGDSGNHFCIMFEALLLGHEDWIYTARWARTAGGDLQLLSASADNSLSIWQPDQESGIWITVARLGEVSREKGATTATGSIGGFWTGLWSPTGSSVVTLGRTGSWRRWDYNADEDMWQQNFAVSGHTRAVTGISWSRDGSYLLSTSSDQTTRLHAEWKTSHTWHEMSRPQIHGYDLNCIDSLGVSSFVSGADEKLMRVFTEPKAVARMLNHLTGGESRLIGVEDSALPDAANMPVLGLSNKAIDVMDHDADPAQQPGVDVPNSNSDREALDPASMVRKSALEIDHPAFEESLSRHTLWPEVEKLYGHGYEISCLATSHDGKLIASACKASSVNHAVIRLFETEHWTEIKPPLTAHSLTVTRIRFSPDDRLLLSVGRDRQWAVFERQQQQQQELSGDSTKDGNFGAYRLLQTNPKGHSRMILDAAWAPLSSIVGDSKSVFATAGRDKQVKIWVNRQKEGKQVFEMALSVAEEHAVTALDFAPAGVAGEQLWLAVGTEGGKLLVLELKAEGDGVSVVSTNRVKADLSLPKAVTQLAWRPEVQRSEGVSECGQGRELAIAGEDGSLRIYSFLSPVGER
ncbi:WD40-repeat-containing domain protein [Apodospora peruviana]|uniref:Elongator complex protein 2 n=1 Tax=Apodospora peruviana TaxID=516989 RepID=A0AAE0IJH9_9PEZI|nr:WD40-repeat-containing domain protein [Apodospora peruviana]